MRKIVSIFAAITIIVISIIVMIAWMPSRPSWQISARNSSLGVFLEVYKSNATQPTYTTMLFGQRINAEVIRATRTELPKELGETTFYDETLRPGRWTIVLDKTEIDITERSLIVDRTIVVAPED